MKGNVVPPTLREICHHQENPAIPAEKGKHAE